MIMEHTNEYTGDTIKTGISTTPEGFYIGHIIVVSNGKFLFSEKSRVQRIDRDDAYGDAIRLRDDALSIAF